MFRPTPVWLFALLLIASPSLARVTPDPRPNIVVVLVDDMGFSDVGCYGGEIDTPNIDALAAQGLRFTQYYNCGRCCPTRASLMTGLHPHQVGIGHMTETPEKPTGLSGPYQGYLNDDCTTLAEVLRDAGYHTLMTGKWHLGIHREECWPLQRGFDRYYGCLSGAVNYFRPGGNRAIVSGNQPAPTDDSFYTTDTFTDVACRFISDATAEDDRPFFLYLAYNAPHWPLNSKWEEYQKYRGRYREGWDALIRSRLARQKEMGLFAEDVVPAPHEGPAWASLSDKQHDDLDSIMAAYAGCIDSIDQNIGKLVSHLDSLGRLENTVIFFLSDNGACQEGGTLGQGNEAMVRKPPLKTTDGVRLGRAWAGAANTPLRRYKHFVHEGGMRTPMIVSWPAQIGTKRGGSFVRQAAYLPDFMPTLVELADGSYPADVPPHAGQSMLPLVEGSDRPIHTEPLFWEHEGNAAVRWGDWKLVRRYQQPWELFNVRQDPSEVSDLAEQQTEKRDMMIALWETWATEHGVAFPERFNMYEHYQKMRKQAKQNGKK